MKGKRHVILTVEGGVAQVDGLKRGDTLEVWEFDSNDHCIFRVLSGGGPVGPARLREVLLEPAR